MGVRIERRWAFETADGRIIERDVAEVPVRINGEVIRNRVIFGDEGTEALLMAFTLEGFLLAPDLAIAA